MTHFFVQTIFNSVSQLNRCLLNSKAIEQYVRWNVYPLNIEQNIYNLQYQDNRTHWISFKSYVTGLIV